jgi:hypothetical protein
MNDLRSRLGLKADAVPLPGEAAYEDTEIGRAPGQLPAASPFESTAPTKFRVISYDENSCKVDEFSDLDSVGRYAGKPGRALAAARDPKRCAHCTRCCATTPRCAWA